MTTTATHNEHDTTTERVLFVAFKLSEKTWKLGFTTGPGQKPRERTPQGQTRARLRVFVPTSCKIRASTAPAPDPRSPEAFAPCEPNPTHQSPAASYATPSPPACRAVPAQTAASCTPDQNFPSVKG